MNAPFFVCRFCNKVLIKGPQRRYETLYDHVADPNREHYPLRDTYICTCEESKKYFWDIFNDEYQLRKGDDIKGIIVGIDILIIMQKPTVYGTWLGVLQRGDEVAITEIRDDHYIGISIDDIEGYVRKRYVQLTQID